MHKQYSKKKTPATGLIIVDVYQDNGKTAQTLVESYILREASNLIRYCP